jgi:hypothetical protein
LHTSTVGGDDKGSLKSERLKDCHEYRGTRTQKKIYAGEGQQHIKIETRPLVREGAPQEQDRNCERVINISS